MRRLLAGAIAAAVTLIPLPSSAHGIGGRQDLPVPLELFLIGAASVLVVSFVALAVLWPRPRLQGLPQERVLLAGAPLGLLRRLLAALGLAALVLAVLTGLFGLQNSTRNPAPVLVFVVFWLLVPFLAALVVNLYPWLNPWRTLVSGLGLGGSERVGHLERVGFWPAVVAFVAFTWLELVWPESGSPRHLAIAALVYTGYLLAYAEWAGRGTALAAGDAFAAYNRLLGAMAPLSLDDQALTLRGWLRGLPHLPERRGLVALVVAAIGTVTYDGLSFTPWWGRLMTGPGELLDGLGWSSTTADLVLGTAGLLGTVGVIGAAYYLASGAAARVGGGGWTTGAVALRFAHSLVPIAFAYAFAHYFTLVLFEGQYLISSLSDPFGLGWDLFGTADRRPDFTLLAPATVWYLQVAVVVLGHVAGVVLAHDRALSDFPPQTAVRSQYAMLVLMVGLTGLALVILAAG